MFARFCKRAVLFASLITIVLFALAQLPPSPREASYLTAVIDKHQRLESLEGPRVILVGGSNVAFGMDSAALETRLGRPVVNFGVSAELGLKYMLQDLRPYLVRGDSVVVMPEYEHFKQDRRAGSALACVLVDIDPDAWRYLSTYEQLSMVEFLGPYVCRKALYWFEVIGNRLLGRTIVESGLEVYNRSSFNKYGDVTVHWPLSASAVEAYPKVGSFSINRSLMEFMAQYSKDLRDSDITMVVIPPALQAASFDNLEPLIRLADQELASRGVGFACVPEKYRFDQEGFFFDTPYHMSKVGIDARMKLLVEDLERAAIRN